MSHRNNVTIAAGVKLAIFTVLSLIITGVLAVIMGNIGFGDSRTYAAVFTDASSLEKGDDVRVAGVSVGEVKQVEHFQDENYDDAHKRENWALVTFRVKADVAVSTATGAEIRFLNLVGDRYLALTQDEDAKGVPLEDGDRIEVDRTTPALDLTQLFNGFKPLFSALKPDQVNELTMNLIQVLQGESGTVHSLLEHTASLTNALADRDELIGEVITNLSTTLNTVDSRHVQLEQLIVELKNWMSDLAKDREKIGDSLSSISDLTVVLAKLLTNARPLLKDDIKELRLLSKLLNKPKNKRLITEIFDRLPESMTDQTRTGTYGSWYNYYVCGFGGTITLPLVDGIPIIKELNKQLADFTFRSSAPRCNK